MTRRHTVPCVHLALLTLVLFAALATTQQATAQAQTVTADPDFWKQTVERQNTVNRLVYSQSPQAIPITYDPVREAEEILRQHQRSLPPSNPAARSVWQQLRGVTGTTKISPALRVLGTVGLAVGTFELGWKIGTGINAKFLKIGVPEATADLLSYRWDRMEWRTARSREYFGTYWPAQDGWVSSMKQQCCTGGRVDRWFSEPCAFTGFVPPAPFVTLSEPTSSGYCSVLYGWAPENALSATGPIETYTNQPHTNSSPAPPAPPQATVEQTIEDELDKPENDELRDWLNYELGSPSQTDPTGIGAPRPDIDFPNREKKWEEHDSDFPFPHADPFEYWQDAADVITKTEDGWPGFEKCTRVRDNAEIYWDPDREAIVIVSDGVIQTFFPPRSPIDPTDTGYARRYFDALCAGA